MCLIMLILNIIFGGVINVLSNKSVMISSFTSWFNLNDYGKQLLNHVKSYLLESLLMELK